MEAAFAAAALPLSLGGLAAAVTSHLRVSRLNALKYHVTGRSYHPQASRPLAVQVARSLSLSLTLILSLSLSLSLTLTLSLTLALTRSPSRSGG